MSQDIAPEGSPEPLSFIKGHGTGNDFVVILDRDGSIEFTAERVAAICDRRFGLGADGLLRVVPATFVADSKSDPAAKLWFMDYSNADGSIAEMCGNGARVFAKFLYQSDLVDLDFESREFVFETRAGEHEAHVKHDEVAINMGKPVSGPLTSQESDSTDSDSQEPPTVTVSVGDKEWSATAWWMPNPHAVVVVDDLAEAGSLTEAPVVTADGLFPDGQNVEFMVDNSKSDTELAGSIRIFERGVGETLSCGTGACAAALALRQIHGADAPGDVAITVPGGSLVVRFDDEGDVWLIGPAEFVAEGTLSL